MSTSQTIQYALMCLQALDAAGESSQPVPWISHREGIPELTCRDMIRRLAQAGLIRNTGPGLYVLSRPAHELHAEEVVRAATTPANPIRRFALWFGHRRRFSVRMTLQALRWAHHLGVELAG